VSFASEEVMHRWGGRVILDVWRIRASVRPGLHRRRPVARLAGLVQGAFTVSTITTTSLPLAPSAPPSAPGEERGVMRGVSWNLYDRLTDAIGERSSIRVAFDGNDVEIMVVGPVHEGLRGLLDAFICLVAEVLDLDFHQLGATTWKREEAGRGLESDVSYCFDPEKVAICRSAHSRGLNDGAIFPIPDLMAEIDISRLRRLTGMRSTASCGRPRSGDSATAPSRSSTSAPMASTSSPMRASFCTCGPRK
jgi:hypothetical protein